MVIDADANRSRLELERALLVIERSAPYLRRHLVELDQAPTRAHAEQVLATAELMLECLQRIADGASAARSLATL